MPITLIDSVSLDNAYGTRTLSLYSGDLTAMSAANHVDFLAVSAFPNDYAPNPDSLIGALSRQGVSVQQLSQNKAASYEPRMPCWISQQIPPPNPNIQFDRLVVFEPPLPAGQNAPANIPSIFHSISCFRNGTGTTSMAMPLVSTGSGGADPATIMRFLFYSAATAAAGAFPLTVINLVVYDQNLIGPMTTLFAQCKSNYQSLVTLQLPGNYQSYAAGTWQAAQSIARPAGMTVRQVFGVRLYTTEYYRVLNRPLWGNNINDPTFIALMPAYQAIDAGLSVLPASARTSYRGESTMDAQRLAQYQVGNVVLHLAYTSTADPAGGWWNTAPFKFVIGGATGRWVAPYSQYPPENEVLFGRNMTDRVTSRSCNSAQSQCTFGSTQVNTNPCAASDTALFTHVAREVM
ncbi:MAG TPA: hypothetical protein VND45_17365 [Thermoanaerobaculia bacterium]|jgi:hypothetical protein|nr:hypothetical protein [Thermoanaerobaculia bacterium]